MRSRSRIAAVPAGALALTGLGLLAAEAATTGAVNLSVSGAQFMGTYKYDVYVNPNQTGVLYNGTLSNTSTADANDAHFYATVSGYGFTQLGGLAQPGHSVLINSIVYDGAARYVTTSRAQVCRDRTFLGQNCSVGTYNK